jgi:hypothetical protein
MRVMTWFETGSVGDPSGEMLHDGVYEDHQTMIECQRLVFYRALRHICVFIGYGIVLGNKLYVFDGLNAFFLDSCVQSMFPDLTQ